ncbi:MAG TPA: EAL domain-containing protein [Thermoanaerobaculia bacterium]|nr:EAL domain-containing protein [Thermoanaerobaculia bacterium]
MKPADDAVIKTPRRVLITALIALVLALGVGSAFIRLADRRSIETRRRDAAEAADAASLRIGRRIDAAFGAAATVAALTRAGNADVTTMAAEAAQRAGVSNVEILEAAQINAPAGTRELLVFVDARRVRAAVRVAPAEARFAAALLDIEELLAQSGVPALLEKGYDYRLAATDSTSGRTVIVARSSPLELQDPVRASFAVPQGRWTLEIVRRAGWRMEGDRTREMALVLIGSILLALFVYDLLRRPYVLEREVEQRTRKIAETNRRLTIEIEQRERAEEQVVHEATHDRLTALPNRVYLRDRIMRALGRTRSGDAVGFGVLVIDLDRFTDVNDGLGHSVGDELLTLAARRLQSCIRFGDVLARVGGDEFAILTLAIDPVEILGVAHRAHEALELPFEVSGHRIQTSASIGIALSASGYTAADELLRDAYLAVHRARQQGGASHVLFDPKMHEQAAAAQQLETELRAALAAGQLRAYFQPIVSLQTGRITGFEALVRWMHPTRGFVSPAAFIPVAVSSGLVIPMDQWMMREAARQVHEWNTRLQLDPPLTVSVNVSGRRLGQKELIDDVAGTLRDTGISTRSLRLEITEGEMMEHPEEVLAILSELKRMDITLLVDDFGTGYSSLSYLHSFPIDIVKIDQSFVRRMLTTAKDEEIVRAVINLSATLGLRVIAEGIETAEHLARLRQLGCDYGQGYLFSKPVDAAAIEALLASNPSW